MATTALTYERLDRLLRYDMATGLFYWKERRGKMRAGSPAGSHNALGYLEIRIDRVLYLSHRLAWWLVTGSPPAGEIDHENLDPSDNRLANLRDASHGQNQANQPIDRTNRSGRKGVSWNRQKAKWESRIQVDGKILFLGYHVDIDAAGRAYEKASVEHFGQFARAA